MIKRWHISDTHFGHDNIRTHCERPFKTCHEMNKFMIDAWNDRVAPDDIVIHYGDFAEPKCKDPRPYLEKLQGHIFLIRGNHDKKQLLALMPMWANYMCAKIGNYNCLLNHRPVYPNEMINLAKDPFHDHDRTHNQADYDFIIGGHIHNGYVDKGGKKVGRLWTGKSLNISVELHDYAPIEEDELIALLDSRFRSYSQNTAERIVTGDQAKWLKTR